MFSKGSALNRLDEAVSRFKSIYILEGMVADALRSPETRELVSKIKENEEAVQEYFRNHKAEQQKHICSILENCIKKGGKE